MTQRIALLLLLLVWSGCSSSVDPKTDRDWVQTSPGRQKLDATILDQLVAEIHGGQFGEIHSLLVSRHGKLVVEEYFAGYTRDTQHRIYSATKSFTSALVGIALDRGEIGSIDQSLLEFFPEYPEVANWDDRKPDITLRHVLSMSLGLQWNEWVYPYGDPRNPTAALWQSSDMLKYMLDLPLSHEPGTRFSYNSGGTILLSGIIRNTTGKSAEAYAAEHLFGHIGIREWEWWMGSDGLTWTSGELHLRPIDMLRFGQLYLNGGVWDDRQVVSEEWVEASTSVAIRPFQGRDYGYQWWRFTDAHSVTSLLRTNDLFYAHGYGGQFIFVIPHLSLVVVTTAGNFDIGGEPIRMLRDFLIPAVLDQAN